jgi:hypothetical protein
MFVINCIIKRSIGARSTSDALDFSTKNYLSEYAWKTVHSSYLLRINLSVIRSDSILPSANDFKNVHIYSFEHNHFILDRNLNFADVALL